MTLDPDQRAYRDLWLAEMGRPVRQWHPPADVTPRRVQRRKRCPECGLLYGAEYLRPHLRRVHGWATVHKAVHDPPAGAQLCASGQDEATTQDDPRPAVAGQPGA